MKDNTFSIKYRELKKSIVAICPRISRTHDFPEIIGTGIIIKSNGIILTCKHVIDAFKKLPREKNVPPSEWPAIIYYFNHIPKLGIMTIPLKIQGVGGVREYVSKIYYGEEIPDMGFIKVAAKNLPTVTIRKETNFQEGEEVFISGFPMGADVLRAPGWSHQFSPTLQKAIISAVLPMPCDNPHALLLDCVLESGASGSAVFNGDSGELVGMVYSGIKEPHFLSDKNDSILVYKTPTAHTLAIPSNYLINIVKSIEGIKEFYKDDENIQTIEELIATAEKEGRITKRQPKANDVGADKISAKNIEFPDELKKT